MTKTKTLSLTDRRPALLLGLMLIAVLLLSACNGRKADRIAFDGQFFRASAKKVDKQRLDFEVTVRPVSASLEGARAAGAYEATRYCVGNFGTSDIDWTDGPDGEDGTLRISNDRLLLTGTCSAL
ncbi:hypothetical protein [uncultured Tateyamaria sp.]|uniref:hypothetical protein n=1 Tax=uncultured Tateyamaria sp. TaxID=455651 RepID=UPI002618D5EF|nr:hypothetical protein [uncultured Tateyamaria sp.]